MTAAELERLRLTDPVSLDDADLCAMLIEEYQVAPTPSCRICGAALIPQKSADPNTKTLFCGAIGKSADHYFRSIVRDWKPTGDPRVLEVVRRLEMMNDAALERREYDR